MCAVKIVHVDAVPIENANSDQSERTAVSLHTHRTRQYKVSTLCTAGVEYNVSSTHDLYVLPIRPKTYHQAVDNAKRLTEGDLENLELARGPAEANRRRMVLNKVRRGAVVQ